MKKEFALEMRPKILVLLAVLSICILKRVTKTTLMVYHNNYSDSLLSIKICYHDNPKKM